MKCDDCRYFVNVWYGKKGVKYGECVRQRPSHAKNKTRNAHREHKCERFVLSLALQGDLSRLDVSDKEIYQKGIL